jgi:hypothetical protein
MANKGCNNCLHYKIGEMKMWEDDIPSKCLLGKDEEFRLWWKENGRKINTDEITDMDCFQETKLSEFCNEASRLLDEMRKVVDRE